MNIHLDVTYENILQTVRDWPPASQLILVQDILKTLGQEWGGDRRSKKTAHLALGLLTMSQVDIPPTDEEISQLLEEHRLHKYGGS